MNRDYPLEPDIPTDVNTIAWARRTAVTPVRPPFQGPTVRDDLEAMFNLIEAEQLLVSRLFVGPGTVAAFKAYEGHVFDREFSPVILRHGIVGCIFGALVVSGPDFSDEEIFVVGEGGGGRPVFRFVVRPPAQET